MAGKAEGGQVERKGRANRTRRRRWFYPSGVDLLVMGKERPLDAEMKDDDTFHKDRKKTQRLCGLCNLCGSQYLIFGSNTWLSDLWYIHTWYSRLFANIFTLVRFLVRVEVHGEPNRNDTGVIQNRRDAQKCVPPVYLFSACTRSVGNRFRTSSS